MVGGQAALIKVAHDLELPYFPIAIEKATGWERIEELRKKVGYELGHSAFLDTLPINIPAQKTASIEPIWCEGKLALPNTPAKSHLKGSKFKVALDSLRTELLSLINDIADEGNIDRRLILFLNRLLDQIPGKSPRHHELFQLAHAHATLAAYSKIVSNEWPSFLAARYHAFVLRLDETIRQSPLWREFKMNAARESLSPEQVTDVRQLAAAAAQILREDEAHEFVDPELPLALETLSEPLRPSSLRPTAPDLPSEEEQTLAYDVLESFNNILKRLLEPMLAVRRVGSVVASEVAKTAKDAATAWGVEARKGVIKEAKSMGRNFSPTVKQWIYGALVLPSAFLGGKSLLQWLLTYPDLFGWLKPIADLLSRS
jgi:hypothetical protein